MARPAPETYDFAKQKALQAGARAARPERRKRSSFGIALMVLTLGFVIGSAWFTLQNIRTDCEKAAGAVVDSLSAGKLGVVYEKLSTEQFRKSTPVGPFMESIGGAMAKLGKVTSSKSTDFHYNPIDRAAYLVFDVAFERDHGQIIMTFIRKSDSWLLDRLRIRSDKWKSL